MSALLSIQESLPLEGTNPCQIVVFSEDSLAHDIAVKVCGGIFVRFENELAFAFSFWEFRDLNNVTLAHCAAEAAARSDIIVLSLRKPDLTVETISLLESCIQPRTKTPGALALIVTDPLDTGFQLERLLLQVRQAAHRLRMDFLPLLPSPDAASSQSDLGYDHWGLNE